ncbi:protein of unknown function [Thauera humireducens]|nr:protein of unknown function [Thauera humireducens]CAH1746832.1 protein of unknown function [Thauera humireducens]
MYPFNDLESIMNQTVAQTRVPTTPATSNKPVGPTGRQSLEEFFALCEAADATWYIGWRWEWPNRAGVLHVCLDGGRTHLRFQYSRRRTGWSSSDDELRRLHTGSARHYAVRQAIEALKQYLAERA